MSGPLLYYITDRSQFPGDESARRAELLVRVRAAAEAGVDYIQLRERDLSARELESLAREAMRTIAGTSARLLINHRADVAIAAGAAGVHLRSGPDELPVEEARAIFHKAGIDKSVIAVSCHTVSEVEAAAQGGADFVVFGPVFGKQDSDGSGVGKLRDACAVAGIPVFALGGIDLENAKECLSAGATGVAGIRLFQEGAIGQTVAALNALDS